MRIVVIGNGVAGNVIGGLLALRGEAVTLICSDNLSMAATNSQGLWLESITGHQNTSIRTAVQLTERPDICLLNMPIQEVKPTLENYKDLLQGVPVITLQNSPRAADYAASVLGRQYIISAAVLLKINARKGHMQYPMAGALLVGEPFDSTGFTESAIALLSNVIQTTYIDNIYGIQWARLITSLHHGLAAATGLTVTQLSEHPTLNSVSVKIIQEAMDITKEKGIVLQSLPDLPPIKKIISVLHMPSPISDMVPLLLSRSEREKAGAELLIYGLQQEGQIAVDFLNGEIIQLGQELGIRTPYNSAITKIVKHIAESKQTLTPEKVITTIEQYLSSPPETPQQLYYFPSRKVAGNILADQLLEYRGEECAVIALSDGAVIVGAQIAERLNCPLSLLLTDSIHLAGELDDLARIDQSGDITYNDKYSAFEINDMKSENNNYIEQQKMEKIFELNRLAGEGDMNDPKLLRKRNVIVVSDGVANGLAMRAASEYLKPIHIQRLIMTTPFASIAAVDTMHVLADKVICLNMLEDIISVDHYYDDNDMPSHEKIVQIVEDNIRHWRERNVTG